MKRHNHLLIAFLVIFHQAFGYLWYDVFFEKAWFMAAGKNITQLNKTNFIPFGYSIVCSIIMCYMTSWFIGQCKASSHRQGALIGFFLWLGISVTTLAVHYKFLGLPDVLIIIDGTKELIGLIVTGAFLATWQKKK